MKRGWWARLVVAVVVCGVVSVPTVDAVGRQAKQAAKRSARPDPVLLVHGFSGSGSNWATLRARLLAAGYRDDEVMAISYDSNQTIPAIAEQVRTAADELLARTGRKRLDIVSHSMGAISSRYYVEELGGDEHVDAWASLAGANDGTYAAYGCLAYLSCNDMAPGSDVLTLLARDLRTDGAVRFGAWWSPCDLIIMPTESAQLAGARNTETACLSHGDIIGDTTVLSQVQSFLRAPHVRAT